MSFLEAAIDNVCTSDMVLNLLLKCHDHLCDIVFVIGVSIIIIIHLIEFDQSRLLGVPDSILPIASAMGYPKVVIKRSDCINRFGLSFIFHDYNLSQLTTIDNSLDTKFLLVHDWIIDK